MGAISVPRSSRSRSLLSQVASDSDGGSVEELEENGAGKRAKTVRLTLLFVIRSVF